MKRFFTILTALTLVFVPMSVFADSEEITETEEVVVETSIEEPTEEPTEEVFEEEVEEDSEEVTTEVSEEVTAEVSEEVEEVSEEPAAEAEEEEEKSAISIAVERYLNATENIIDISDLRIPSSEEGNLANALSEYSDEISIASDNGILTDIIIDIDSLEDEDNGSSVKNETSEEKTTVEEVEEVEEEVEETESPIAPVEEEIPTEKSKSFPYGFDLFALAWALGKMMSI